MPASAEQGDAAAQAGSNAQLEVGSGGYDATYLDESPGDDILRARDRDPTEEDRAQLYDEALALYALWGYRFDYVEATSGVGDDDTVYSDPEEDLDFELVLSGYWEN